MDWVWCIMVCGCSAVCPPPDDQDDGDEQCGQADQGGTDCGVRLQPKGDGVVYGLQESWAAGAEALSCGDAAVDAGERCVRGSFRHVCGHRISQRCAVDDHT